MKDELIHTAKLVAHHDDSPCTERLVDGFCPQCKFNPDMQSTTLVYYCCHCDVKLIAVPDRLGGISVFKCNQCETKFFLYMGA